MILYKVVVELVRPNAGMFFSVATVNSVALSQTLRTTVAACWKCCPAVTAFAALVGRICPLCTAALPVGKPKPGNCQCLLR